MPRFKSIIFFIKIVLKLNYFCKKMKNFRALGVLRPSASGAPKPPLASVGWGSAPRSPQTAPPLRIFGFAPDSSRLDPTIEPVT